MTVLLAFKGAPGTGKSTLARTLSRQLGWPLVDKDDIKDVLDGQTPNAGPLAFDVMLSIVRRQLLQGVSVVCDSPLHRETYRNARRVAAATGARLLVIECRCSDERLWRARIEERQERGLAPHHTTTWETLQAWRRRTADEEYEVIEPCLVVDTAAGISESVSQVLDWLRRYGVRAPETAQ